MKTEFRNRAFLPLVMPLAILGVVGVVVGLVALILLYVDRQGAVALALLAAAGILVAISLATSQDKLDAARRGAIGLAAVAPLAVGGLVAAGVIGGLSDADRNINVEPHGVQFVFAGVEDGVPTLAAESLNGFCLPAQCDGSSVTHEWEMTEQQAEEFAYAFDNRDPSTPHNLYVYNVPPDELDGLSDALPLSDVQANYQTLTPGDPPNVEPGTGSTFRWTPPAEGEQAGDGGGVPIPEVAYFVCTLHPSTMWGVATITTG